MDKYQPHTYLLALLDGDGFSCPNHEALKQELIDAIHKGYLPVADVRVRDDSRRPPAINGWRSLGDGIGKLAGVGTWIADQGAVQYILEPQHFREWLKSTGRWPLPPGHALAEWLVARPGEHGETRERQKPKREREINRWLRETWKSLGRPTGARFFMELKRYRGETGSPITEWYSAGAGKGISYRASSGVEGSMSYKTLANKVSQWKTCQAQEYGEFPR